MKKKLIAQIPITENIIAENIIAENIIAEKILRIKHYIIIR